MHAWHDTNITIKCTEVEGTQDYVNIHHKTGRYIHGTEPARLGSSSCLLIAHGRLAQLQLQQPATPSPQLLPEVHGLLR